MHKSEKMPLDSKKIKTFSGLLGWCYINTTPYPIAYKSNKNCCLWTTEKKTRAGRDFHMDTK